MKISRYVLVPLLAGVGLFSGCQPDESARDSSNTAGQNQADSVVTNDVDDVESSIFTGTGLVMNITPSRTFIVIEHQDIIGFMGAMTMPFAINDENVLESIAVGDSIDFELTVTGSETYVSSITSTVH